MALEVAALQAPMTSSSGSLSAPSVTSGCPPKRARGSRAERRLAHLRNSAGVAPVAHKRTPAVVRFSAVLALVLRAR